MPQSHIHSVSVPFQRRENTNIPIPDAISQQKKCSLLFSFHSTPIIAYFEFLEECNYAKFIANETRNHKLVFWLFMMGRIYRKSRGHQFYFAEPWFRGKSFDWVVPLISDRFNQGGVFFTASGWVVKTKCSNLFSTLTCSHSVIISINCHFHFF